MMRNDFFEYRLLSGNKANRTELESETLPFTFKSNSHKLRNYRIYGNENGVGDLQENGKYLIPVTIKGKNIMSGGFNRKNKNQYVDVLYVEADLESNTTYTISFILNRGNQVYLNGNLLSNNQSRYTTGTGNRQSMTFTTGTISRSTLNQYNSDYGWILFKNAKNQEEYTTFTDVMLVEGTESLGEYEPYHEPKTVNIYLDEPLNENDYIDFREQKRFNSDDTSEIISMPTLPTINGTNIFTVDTEVQPSKVYIQGKISEIPSVSQSLQSSPQTLNLQPLSLDVMPIDRSEFQINDISEVPETENFETSGGEENAE